MLTLIRFQVSGFRCQVSGVSKDEVTAKKLELQQRMLVTPLNSIVSVSSVP